MSTTADYVLSELCKDQSGEFTQGFLKAGVLGHAADDLFYARRNANLTQAQVAKRTGKKQSAVARWERDTGGNLSLCQYVELALACGMIPRITLVPVEEAKQGLFRELAQEAST